MSDQPQSGSADSPELARWQAAPHHWDALEQAGRDRGWKLAAMSFGYAPIAGVIDALPDEQKNELRNRRTQVKRHLDLPGDSGLLRQAIVGREQDSAIECYYDVAGFVKWIESLAVVGAFPNTVHPEMKRIAERWTTQGPRVEKSNPDSPEPTKNQKAGKTRVEDPLRMTLLALAIHHYEYVPLGLKGSKKMVDMQQVYDDISRDVSAFKLDVRLTPDIIKKRLLEAVEKLSEKELAQLGELLTTRESTANAGST